MVLRGEIIMYHVVTVQNNAIPAIFNYSTFEEALASYHNELAYRHESRTSTKCAILDSDLHMLRQEIYTAPTPNVEPEDTEGE